MKLRGQRNDGSDRLLPIHLEGGAPVSLYNNMYVSVFSQRLGAATGAPQQQARKQPQPPPAAEEDDAASKAAPIATCSKRRASTMTS